VDPEGKGGLPDVCYLRAGLGDRPRAGLRRGERSRTGLRRGERSRRGELQVTIKMIESRGSAIKGKGDVADAKVGKQKSERKVFLQNAVKNEHIHTQIYTYKAI